MMSRVAFMRFGYLVPLWVWFASAAIGFQDRPESGGNPSGENKNTKPMAVYGTSRLRHAGYVTCVVYSAKGDMLVSGGYNFIRVWDRKTGDEINAVKSMNLVINGKRTHALYDPPTCLARSPDDGTIVWGTTDGRIYKLVGLEGDYQKVFETETNVEFIAFSRDGKTMAFGDRDGKLFLWDFIKGSLKGQWNIPVGRVGSASGAAVFLADGKTLVSGGGKSIQVWDLVSLKLAKEIPVLGDRKDMQSLDLSPDGKILAIGSSGFTKGRITLLETATLQVIRSWDVKYKVQCLQFSPDGKTLVAGKWGDAIQIFDPQTGREKARLQSKAVVVKQIAFSPDGSEMASVGGDCTVHRWDLQTMREIQLSHGHTDSVRQVAFSHDGAFLASCSSDKSARIWSLKEPGKTPVVLDHPKRVNVVAFFPGDKELFSQADDGLVRFWQWRKGLKIKELALGPVGAATPTPGSVALAPDARTIAMLNRAGEIAVYETTTGKGITRVKAHEVPNFGVVGFSPDGTMLASVGGDALVNVWDTTNWTPIGSLIPGERGVRRLSPAFSPDGRVLAFAWDSRRIRVVDAKGGWALLGVINADGIIGSMAYSPSGNVLAVGTSHVSLWEPTIVKKLGQLPECRAGISCLAFSPDGKKLAAGLRDSTVIVWDVTAFTGSAEKQP